MGIPSVFSRFDMRAAFAAVLCVVALAAAAGTAGVPGEATGRQGRGDGDVDGRVLTTLRVPGAEGSSVRLHGGIPLSRAAGVRDTGRLVLARRVERPDGSMGWESVGAQWHAAARWGGRRHDDARPLRWVHVAAIARGGESLAVLGSHGPHADHRPPLATVHEHGVDVDTGALRFTVRRDRFAPFDAFLSKRGSSADFVTGPLTGSADAVLDYVVAADDGSVVERTTRLTRSVPESVAIESTGPVRATIVVRGAIDIDGQRPTGSLRYTLRLHVWRDAGDVDVAFSLTNTAPDTPVLLRSARLDVPTSLGAAVRVTTSDGGFDTASAARLVQRHDLVSRDSEAPNFTYALDVDGDAVATGERSDGWLAVSAGERALRISVERFWQRWPGALAFSAGVVTWELLPSEPGLRWPPDAGDLPVAIGDAYRLDAGRRSTWRATLGAAAEHTSSEPVRRPGLVPAYVARTGAVGATAPAEFDVPDSALRTLVRRHARLQRALVDVAHAQAQGPGGVVLPASIATQRELRGNADPSMRHDADLYGWVDDGDLVDSRGYTASAHDWLDGLLLAYLRHGEPLFLDEAEVALRHRVDVDQRHTARRDGRQGPALAASDQGRHGRWASRAAPRADDVPVARRTRLRGLLLAHAVTAEPQAMEAAVANAQALVSYAQEQAGDGSIETDMETWAVVIRELLAFHDHTGEERARAAALQLFERGLLAAEERSGGDGSAVLGGRPLSAGALVSALDACVAVHESQRDPRALSLLLRFVRRLRDEGLAETGRPVRGRYVPLQLRAFIGAPVSRAPASIPLAARASDPVAYAWQQTGEDSLRTLALRLFRDGVAFRDAPAGAAVAPGVHSVPSAVPRAHAGMEVALGAWTLRSHDRLLSVLATRDARPVRTRWRDQPFFAASLAAIDESDRPFVAELLGRDPTMPNAPLRLALSSMELRGDTLVLRTHVSAPSRLTARLQPADGVGVALAGRVGPSVPALARRHEVSFEHVSTGATYLLRIVARDAADRVQVLGPVAVRPQQVDFPTAEAPPVREQVPLPPPVVDLDRARGSVVLDDADARKIGAWRRVEVEGAVGGAQSVATDVDEPAVAEFVHSTAEERAYRLFIRWERVPGAATDVRVEIEDSRGWTWQFWDQRATAGGWELLGTVLGVAGGEVVVRVSNVGAGGAVAVDALRLDEVDRP